MISKFRDIVSSFSKAGNLTKFVWVILVSFSINALADSGTLFKTLDCYTLFESPVDDPVGEPPIFQEPETPQYPPGYYDPAPSEGGDGPAFLKLTPARKQILFYTTLGFTSVEVAEKLNMKVVNVRSQIADLIKIFGVHNTEKLTSMAIAFNIINPEEALSSYGYRISKNGKVFLAPSDLQLSSIYMDMYGEGGPFWPGKTERLSSREQDVLLLMIYGRPKKVIADKLSLTIFEVAHAMERIKSKLRVRDNIAAITKAVYLGPKAIELGILKRVP